MHVMWTRQLCFIVTMSYQYLPVWSTLLLEMSASRMLENCILRCLPCRLLQVLFKLRTSHSRPQWPQSFWSAPRIKTSGRRQDQTSVNHRLIVKSGKSDWLKIQSKYSAHVQKIGSGQRSWSLVLTKRIAASGNENEDLMPDNHSLNCCGLLETRFFKCLFVFFSPTEFVTVGWILSGIYFNLQPGIAFYLPRYVFLL